MAHIKKECKARSEVTLLTPLNPPASGGRVTSRQVGRQPPVAFIARILYMSQKNIETRFTDNVPFFVVCSPRSGFHFLGL